MPYNAEEWENIYYNLTPEDRAALCREFRRRIWLARLKTQIVQIKAVILPAVPYPLLTVYGAGAVVIFLAMFIIDQPLHFVVYAETVLSVLIYNQVIMSIINRMKSPVKIYPVVPVYELGVDLPDLDFTRLKVLPTPEKYCQRLGRTGRSSTPKASDKHL